MSNLLASTADCCSATSILEHVCFSLQRVLGDPKNTTKAYWPKIQEFLRFKAKQRLLRALNPKPFAAEASPMDQAVPELHSRDHLVDSCDYLEFRDALEQGRVGLGITSRGQSVRRVLLLQVEPCQQLHATIGSVSL